ncbi:MAG TPA: OmpA family protein [Candidatus Eisenbacteria bacterium]|nr:OmpA family protein [Candidatus Eisenbacteria bacterium]
MTIKLRSVTALVLLASLPMLCSARVDAAPAADAKPADPKPAATATTPPADAKSAPAAKSAVAKPEAAKPAASKPAPASSAVAKPEASKQEGVKPAVPPVSKVTAPAAAKAPPPAPAASAGGVPYIELFPAVKVTERSTREFDEYWIALGKLKGDGQAEKAEQADGKWTHAGLVATGTRTVAEVFRHYEQQVVKGGFEIQYDCKGVDCGEGGRRTNGDWWALSDNRRYLAARLQRPRGDVWVTVHVHAKSATAPVEHEVDVVEMKPPVVPPAPRDEGDVLTLAKELDANGRVVLRSVGFADGKPVVLPASERVVAAIAELLASKPGLKLHVVVHGDDAAPITAGVELSKKRAAALVSALKQKHKVGGGRVLPVGLGALAPVASNATEEGRTQNRRVELIPETSVRATASVRR